MNRYVLGAALMSAIGISALAPAQYQSNKLNSTPSGVTFRGGVVFPIDSTLRDIDTTFFGVGLEYLFASSYLHTGETFLSFDWIGRSSTGERANLYPVMINQRFYSGKSRYGYGEGRAYWFAGVGVIFIQAGGSDTKLGARGGLGYELGPSVIAEVAGTIGQRADNNGGLTPSTLGVYVGYRFP